NMAFLLNFFLCLYLTVLSIVGNLLVLIMAVKRSSKLKPPEFHHWLGGHATCVYYGLAGFFFGVASIMNLVIMAIVLLKQCHISWRNAKLLCVWIWIYALLWALLPLLGWGHYGPEPFGLSCTLAWGDMKEESVSFIISLFVFNLALPSVVIICCYFGIAIKLYVTYKKLGISYNRMPNTIKIHRRLLIVSIAVLISMGFIGSWTPYGLVSLWSIFRDSRSIPPEVSLLPCMFAKTSTVYNPLIYYFFSHTFKLEVRKLVCNVCLRTRAWWAGQRFKMFLGLVFIVQIHFMCCIVLYKRLGLVSVSLERSLHCD
uniref:Opsin 8, group member b n=1 Tax=Neogobius melanostomus TaxID=47308 RepID=A0A8C6SIK8_9GOBI